MSTSEHPVEETQIPRVEVEVDVTPESNPEATSSESFVQWLNQVKAWYDELPTAGKVIVAVLVLCIGLSTLGTVLELVSSLLSIAVLVGILYLLFKFLSAPRSSE